MATQLGAGTLVRGEPAGGDLSASQYLFVEYTTGALTVCNAAGDFAVGVLMDKRADAAGKTAQIYYFGPCKVIAGDTITKGDLITTDASGKAVTVSPNGGAGDVGKAILGRALEAAGAANVVISALINCINPAAAT